MIPILYESTETTFSSNGLGRLAECISCVVTEERNGIYECEFQYPVDGQMYSQITEGRIISVTHDDKGDRQPFDIYGRTAPIDGIVTFYAHHISYRLRNVILRPFTATSCADALSKFATQTYTGNPFTFWTDKAVTAPYKLSTPASAREMLAGESGSILDVYGKGEYQFDKFAVKLYVNRGTDSGVKIKYGLNLIDLKYDKDISDMYNSVVPFWASADDGTVVTLTEGILSRQGVTDVIAVPLDLTDAFEEQPTETQLRNAAQSRLDNSEAYLPKENLDVDFVALWQTPEYSNYAALQRLSLCDWATVQYIKLGVNAKMQIVRTVYNVLTNRFDRMELGSLRPSLADMVSEQIEMQVLPKFSSRSMLEAAVKHATDLITGGLGGYVVFTLNANGQPEEILIMDTPDTSTAVNVWRFNSGGLGHSSSGYGGPYSDVALTADGQINASLITTGTLVANIIKAGVISDVDGYNSWDLSSGTLEFTKGSISFGATRGFYVGPYGDVAVGLKPSDMSSFENNKTAFQANIWGQVKMTEAYLYGRGTSSDDFIKYAMFDYVPTYVDGTTYRAMRISVYDNSGTKTDCVIYTPVAALVQHDLKVFGNASVTGNLTVTGTKNRAVKTKSHGTRKLYAYETAAPYFGDIGEDQIGIDGKCVVEIDKVFSETIGGYQVFISPYGRGECYVTERGDRSFTVEGTPGLRFAWEIKGRQIDYQDVRLERMDENADN